MSESLATIFVFSLLQDVTVLRPLIYLAHDDFGVQPFLVICPGFRQRDREGVWQLELNEVREQTGAEVIHMRKAWELWQRFSNTRGAVFFGSESELNNHGETRELARCAPQGLTKVALQHGYECVGFLMNRHHIAAHGSSISMESDLLCSWLPLERLRDLRPMSQSRVIHTGPSILMKSTTKRLLGTTRSKELRSKEKKKGLICENLHSVRFELGGEARSGFLDVFENFAAEQSRLGNEIALRPHPAGQYTIRNKGLLPENVTLELKPTYKIDWEQYSYGISAPSSVLIDMTANGVSAAAWIDEQDDLDTSNYGALAKVCTLDEWLQFSSAPASTDQVLNRLLPGVTPETCTNSFRDLLQTLLEREPEPSRSRRSENTEHCEALAYPILIADDPQLPTLQICLLSAMAQMPTPSRVKVLSPTRTNKDMGAAGLPKEERLKKVLDMLETAIDQGATSAIFCRYVGPFHLEILAKLNERKIKSFYFIDDLLTNVPAHIGLNKQKRYGSMPVRGCLLDLLNSCDQVVTSSQTLAQELPEQNIAPKSLRWLGVSCSGTANQECDQNLHQVDEGELVIGYMGFDHDADFDPIAGVVAKVLDQHTRVRLEMIGPMKLHPKLERHANRIITMKPIYNYGMFMELLASRRWHIGLAPLIDSRFNRCKSINKWIEYTSCGIVTVASQGLIYDSVCKVGGGLLAATADEWTEALNKAITHQDLRRTTLQRAQALLGEEYSPERHWKCLQAAFQAAMESSTM